MNADARHITLATYPQAILHFDGDAFFASIEQVLHPALKGRPVVTGKERGLIACASYEAKARGIRRGVPLWQAKKRCPDLVVLPSDYETYSLFSRRMFQIIRRHTPTVEEHSIDEGFADITGLRRMYRTSYKNIVLQIQEEIQRELGFTVSVGLSLTKVLAKLASRYVKPRGCTAVPGHGLHLFLPRLPLEAVWGFGPNTVELLKKHGLNTAFDFVCRPERWAEKQLGKTGREVWNELRGVSVYPVEPDQPSERLTLSKCKSFTTPSADKDFLFAGLVRNIESACIKLRRHRLRARSVTVGLRRKDFAQAMLEARLNRATSSAPEALPVARELFDRLCREGTAYRTVLVVFGNLEEEGSEQFEMFEDRLAIEKLSETSAAIDRVNARYGKHTLALGSSLYLARAPRTPRDEPPWRKLHLLQGENARRRLNLPVLAVTV